MPPIVECYERLPYTISTDPARLDVSAVHQYLAGSYWAEGIPCEIVRRSLEASLCFGLYAPEGQIGLTRVITDRATFASPAQGTSPLDAGDPRRSTVN